MISIARLSPNSLGRRCVPPQPGSSPSPHLGLTHLRARRGDPQVAGEGDLKPAAEGVAVDRGDQRFGDVQSRA